MTPWRETLLCLLWFWQAGHQPPRLKARHQLTSGQPARVLGLWDLVKLLPVKRVSPRKGGVHQAYSGLAGLVAQ